MKSIHPIRFTLAVGLAASSHTLLAEESQDAIEPKVIEHLTGMASYFNDAQTLSFKSFTTNEDVSSTLQKLQFDTTLRGAIQRPDKVYFDKTGAENGALWFDGTTATVLDREQKKFVKFAVNGGIDALLDKLDSLGIETPLADLLRGGLLDHVKKNVFKADDYGEVLIADIPTHHLAFRQDDIDWQLWVKSDTNEPVKVVITSKMLAGAPQHMVVFKDLVKNEALAAGTFTPQLPADAVEIPLAARDQLDNQPW